MYIAATYPEKIKYEIHIKAGVTDPIELFPQHIQKKVLKSIPRLLEPQYYFKVERVTKELLEKFIPIYTELIEAKERPKVHDIKKNILVSPRHNYPYYILSLYQAEQFLGGMLFSAREESLVAAYKAYPHQLDVKLKTGVSMIADYFYFEYALKLGKSVICNGRDRNIYGPELSIGLANYKISAGYTPYVTSDRNTVIYDHFDWNETNDVLIMLGNDYNQKVDRAILLLSSEREIFQAKYPEIFKAEELELEIIEKST